MSAPNRDGPRLSRTATVSLRNNKVYIHRLAAESIYTIECKDAARATELSSNPLTISLCEQSATMEESREVSIRSYFLAATICSVPWTFSASKLAAQDAHFHNAPTSGNQLTG